jgi:hypothetical protein
MTFVRNHALAWNRLCESLMMACCFLLRGNGKGCQGRPDRSVEGLLRNTPGCRFPALETVQRCLDNYKKLCA